MSGASQKLVRYEAREGVAWVTLADPRRGNALGAGLLADLAEALGRAEADPACRAIVLAAEGPEFCRGLDLEAAFADGGAPDPATFGLLTDCLARICDCARPVVAAVDGAALGGGVGLAAACDLVLAGEAARFQLPELIVGMLPALIAPFLLRRLSVARVRALAISTRALGPREAQQIGLVDELAEEGLEAALRRQLRRLLRSSPEALAQTKRYLAGLEAQQRDRQVALARQELEQWLAQPEVVAGIRAFSQGSAPPWFQRYKG